MITRDSPFLTPPSISPGHFAGLLNTARSPWTDDAGALYAIIQQADQDPAIWLAIAAREHNYGTNQRSVLYRNKTNSWTNARTVRDPTLTNWSIITDQYRKSSYVRYENVLDSMRDGVYRVEEPGYEYRTTHAYSIVDYISIWTEEEPDDYVNSIVTLVNRWQASDPHPQIPFIPAKPTNYTYSRSVWPNMLIGHHTDGYDSLAELTTGARHVSATYLLHRDGTIRAQLVRHRDTPHTTGGEVNGHSLSFELERKWPEEEWISAEQYANIAQSTATIWRRERKRGNPICTKLPNLAHYRDHNDFANTVCPGNLSMDRVFTLALALLLPDYATPQQEIELQGRRIYGGIYQAWRMAGGLAGPGYPLDDEHDAPSTVDYDREQWFERSRAEWAPGRYRDNYDVTWGLLGVELLHMIHVYGLQPSVLVALDQASLERERTAPTTAQHRRHVADASSTRKESS